MVLNGDVPLIKPETLNKLLNLHDSRNADVSLITTTKKNPHGYGRVFLKGGFIEKIVEEKDCDNQERLNLLIAFTFLTFLTLFFHLAPLVYSVFFL